MLLKGLEEVAFGKFKSMDDETIESVYVTNNAVGGPTQFEIQNTSPTPQQVYAGDGLFRVSGKGNGQITATFAAQDIPADAMHAILGYVKDEESGLWVVGKETKLTYGSIYCKTHDINDKSIWMGLLKGTFTRGQINAQTNQAQETDATDTITFTAVNRKKDGLAYFEGLEADDITEDIVHKFVFPDYKGGYDTTTSTTTTTTTVK